MPPCQGKNPERRPQNSRRPEEHVQSVKTLAMAPACPQGLGPGLRWCPCPCRRALKSLWLHTEEGRDPQDAGSG